MPIPLGPPRPLHPQSIGAKPQYNLLPTSSGIEPIVMRPIFFDPHTNQIIDRTPQVPEKEKPFSDILKKK